MSSAAGAHRPDPAAQRGFTLLEILLVIALIAMLSAGLVSAAIHVVDNQPRTPEAVFWAANTAARRAALQHERDVVLSYDTKEKQFVVTDDSDTQDFPIPNAKDLTVDLLQGQATTGGAGSVLIGGELVATGTLPNVTYYPDGTCAPFRVQFRANGPARIVAIDPWTCAPMLEKPGEKP